MRLPAAIHRRGGSIMSENLLVTPGERAPDFEIEDIQGNLVRLSDFAGRKTVLLAFLRGFM
jgi:peroxiredoxin